MTAITVRKSQNSQAAIGTSDVLESGIALNSSGQLQFAGQGDFYRTTPSSILIDKWLTADDRQVASGSDYEVEITQVSGTITGTTTGYVSLGTTRTVLGRSANANSNLSLTDQARIKIRKVGAGSDDVNVVITFEVDTQR